MELLSMKEIADFLIGKGERLKSISPDEIVEMEKRFNVTLPAVYKQFLGVMGRSAGEYMKGSSVFYDEIFILRQGTEELVIENKIDPFPISAFVFWMHQGYQAAYFLIEDGDDPPVYYFSEGENLAVFFKGKFTY